MYSYCSKNAHFAKTLQRVLRMLFMNMINSLQTTEQKLPAIHRAPEKEWHTFLGYKIASRVGISACAATTSKGIWLAARLGCDLLTYKTIRCYAWPAHPAPNIAYIEQSAS